MISAIIPTCNSAATLPAAFRSLIEATVDGLVSEVIVCDCGSADKTLEIADDAGATILRPERGRQLLEGARAARRPWLLFMNPSSTLEPGWEDEARAFIEDAGGRAGAFSLRLAAKGAGPRLRETLAAMRAWAFGLPGRCDAVLMPARLFDAAAARGSGPVEPVDLIRRLGRGKVVLLKSAAICGTALARR